MEESFDKPSFLIYKHDFNSISYFSDELLGLLFRTICEYQNDKMVRIDVDPRIMQAFQFFKTLSWLFTNCFAESSVIRSVSVVYSLYIAPNCQSE